MNLPQFTELDFKRLVFFLVFRYLEFCKLAGVNRSRSNQIIVAIIIDNSKIFDAGELVLVILVRLVSAKQSLFSNAQLKSSREPLVCCFTVVVVLPEHDVRVQIMVSNAEIPSVYANALPNSNAQLLSVVTYFHFLSAQACCSEWPSRSTDEIIYGDWSNAILFTKGVLSKIFLPIDDGRLSCYIGDCLWHRPDISFNGAGVFGFIGFVVRTSLVVVLVLVVSFVVRTSRVVVLVLVVVLLFVCRFFLFVFIILLVDLNGANGTRTSIVISVNDLGSPSAIIATRGDVAYQQDQTVEPPRSTGISDHDDDAVADTCI